jgi:hypothetical protein
MHPTHDLPPEEEPRWRQEQDPAERQHQRADLRTRRSWLTTTRVVALIGTAAAVIQVILEFLRYLT